MKKLFLFMAPLLWLIAFAGCTKTNDQLPTPDGPVPMRPPVRPTITDRVLPRPVLQAAVCINSYKELVAALGTASLSLQSVILENGQTLAVGGTIASMRYSAKDGTSAASLFHSALQVDHTYYGVLQTHFQDVWSLGCVHTSSAVPPFTNLWYRNRLYLINTAFTWTVPPLGTAGYRVAFIVAQ